MKDLLNRFISGLLLSGVLMFLFLHEKAESGIIIHPFPYRSDIPIFLANYYYVLRLTIAPILYGAVHFIRAKHINYLLAIFYVFEVFNVLDMILAYNQTPYREFGAKVLYFSTCFYIFRGELLVLSIIDKAKEKAKKVLSWLWERWDN